MKTIMKILIIGMLAVLFVTPATAAAEPTPSITIWVDSGFGYVEIEDEGTCVVEANSTCTFKAEYNNMPQNIGCGFEISNESGLITYLATLSDGSTVIVLEYPGYELSEGEAVTLEAAVMGYGVGILVVEGDIQQTPEPTTIAMTAIGLLAVLGFVFRRKEDK